MKSKFLLFIVLLGGSSIFTSCFHRKVVSSCNINAIRLQHVQAGTPDGQPWDAFGSGLGDIQLRIKNKTTNQVIYVSETFEDASYTNTYMFLKAVPFLIHDLNSEYRLDVYDVDDFSGDEWMGGFELNLPDYIDKREIHLTSTSTPMEIFIVLDWNYQEKKKK